jgi:hypothetical protein
MKTVVKIARECRKTPYWVPGPTFSVLIFYGSTGYQMQPENFSTIFKVFGPVQIPFFAFFRT